ncbi:putative transporter C11D3.18C [Grifola frondosa]|uniref:Putative transporter C11D3.18C n=1 Tax=Grifola frondosa TaxID=5627 RepID=A0A1C7LLZ0_GRIFR|nr:putative transporter C11D3.18C [Grifola frondosa]
MHAPFRCDNAIQKPRPDGTVSRSSSLGLPKWSQRSSVYQAKGSTPSFKENASQVGGDVEKQYNRAPSASAEGGDYKTRFPHIDEAKVIRKIDCRVVLVLCLLYLLAFLDRVNISNAAVFGLKTDLKLGGNEYNIALVVFFIPYIVFEIPSNALLKHFKPHVWLSICMFLFGLITILQGLTQSFSGLVAARFFLGIVETGVFPACFYLIAIIPKALLILVRVYLARGRIRRSPGQCYREDGWHKRLPWLEMVFILEGAFTCVVAAMLYFAIPDFPEEVKWLTAEEKEFVKARLYEDVGDSRTHEPLNVRSVLDVFKDYKIIVGGFMYFTILVPAYGYAYFAPTIIQGLGHSSIRTQLLSVPPWGCAFVLSMIVATASDYFKHRFTFILVLTAVALTGFIILLVEHHNTKLQYAALYLAAIGMYSAMPITVCWFNTNLGGHRRRAVGTAWQVGFGNFGGIIAVFTFLAKDAPKYIHGYSICIAFLCLFVLVNVVYFFGVTFENRMRDRLQASGASVLSEDEKKCMGDLNPDYRYFR